MTYKRKQAAARRHVARMGGLTAGRAADIMAFNAGAHFLAGLPTGTILELRSENDSAGRAKITVRRRQRPA